LKKLGYWGYHNSACTRILRALIALPVVQYEFLGLATKCGINALNYSIVSVKSAIWSKFASSVVF